MADIDQGKQQFVELYNKYITRAGAKELLDYLLKSDFFTAPASAKYHMAESGGLCLHSINVCNRLASLVRAEYGEDYAATYTDETIAVCGLLHDVCKVNYYAVEQRNVKEEGGWVKKPFFKVDERFPYGHGEKSAYIVSGFLRLTREEAFAIRYHMGFSGTEDPGNVGKALEMFPLAYALVCADMEAAFLMEGKLTPPADAVKP